MGMSQNSIGLNPRIDSKASQLFESEEYHAVVELLESKDPLTVSDQYLVEISKLNLELTNTERLTELVDQNPKFYLNSQANFSIAKYHFYNDDYNASEKALKRIDGSTLDDSRRNEYYFMRGYVLMQDEKYNNAQQYFQRASNTGSINNDKLAYYQGFIAYHLNQKEAALTHLEKVSDDSGLTNSATFFKAKIFLEQGKYDEVVTLAQSSISDDRTVTNSELNQLIGEAYALQDKASKAANYFEKAIELHPSQPSAALYYQAGVANFKISFKARAIEYLTEAGIQSGEYAHLSAFQLGRLYLASDEKEKASVSYIEASASSDKSIRAEALFKAGKLLLDLGNFTEGINYLDDYLSEFTNGESAEESQNLIAEAYLRTSNYDQAINHLRATGISTKLRQDIYQKVAYQKAWLLFNDGLFTESITWFQESLKHPNDLQLSENAKFNIGEAYFTLTRYNEALTAYKSQNNSTKEALYGIGYSHFNLFEYDECISFFERFLRTDASRSIKRDAELRLADAYYATKAYDKALVIYRKLLRLTNSKYVAYQIGIIQRNLGNREEAINSFENVLKMEADSLSDDAVYQIAQLHFENAEFERSEFHFSSLIAKHPGSSLIPEAYLNRAISRSNLGKNEEANADYQYILSNHITSDNAFNAILGLQELESKGVAVGDIQELIADFRKANPDDESLEVIDFEFAKSQYFNLKYAESSASFKRFVGNYPESANLNDAKYYLADSYYRNGELEQAKEVFTEISKNNSGFSGRIFSRLGAINFQLSSYSEAIDAYEQLLALDLSPKDNYNALAGLMNTYFEDQQYENSIKVADQISEVEWKPLNGERNARLIKGQSLLALNQGNGAEQILNSISTESDRISAEASFLLAKMKFDRAEHDSSLESLFSFNSKFGSYQDLVDQSYLLIAKNYISKDELFQAKATLRSIIQHSEDEELKAQAMQLIAQIENQPQEDSISNKQ